MDFRISGLPAAPFEPLFGLSDGALAERGARRMVADAKPGFPCRITLEDAEPGETLILLSHQHQPADSPYRASGPIFVRERARETFDRTNHVPEQLRGRLLSVRAYDGDAMIVDAEVVEGVELDGLIDRLLSDRQVAYLHVHFARRGCYACRIDRA
jgi:hypothetical protein